MGLRQYWYQIGNNTSYIPKVSKFYVDFMACKCVFYGPWHNGKEESYGIELWISWNVKMKYTNRLSSKKRWKEWSHLSSYHVYHVYSFKVQKWLIFVFSADGSEEVVIVWVKYLSGQ